MVKLLREHKSRVRRYKSASVGADKGWKAKYRKALALANKRLIDNGLEPVYVYKNRTKPKQQEKHEQLTLF